MKPHHIRFSSIFLRMTIIFSYLFLVQPAPVRALATIRYVAPASGCISTPNCYANIQAAVNAAASGDEIRVAAGTYSDLHDYPRLDTSLTGSVRQVVYITKTITIRGGYNSSFRQHDPASLITLLDAGNGGRGLYIAGDISPVIEDLRITRGSAAGLGGYEYYGTYDAGGGVFILNAAVSLKNTRIFNNSSPNTGAGVFMNNSLSLLDGNTISGNQATTLGGAGLTLRKSDATLTGNRIISNTSSNLGGGLYLFESDATLTYNSITGNTASSNGGGLDVASCSPTLTGNLISGNTSRNGAGVYLWYSSSILTNNAIRENVGNNPTSKGNGLWIGGSTPQLLHNTVSHNTGGEGIGIYVNDDGASTTSTATMQNSLIANQTVGISVTTGNTAALDGVLWYGNGTNMSGAGTHTAAHAYTGSPAFAADGYHLTPASAARNKGISTTVTTDIDGDPRLGLPDLGADEYVLSRYLPLTVR
jgi:parallel beta-helix repeat protein